MGALDAVTRALTGGSGDYGPGVTPGSVAAWAVSFHHDTAGDLGEAILTVGSDTYDGSVAATLPEGLGGGSYEVVVEGMTDGDYAKVRRAAADPLAAKLHLWWKDAPGFLGDLANMSGFADPLGAVTPRPPEHSLVAVLRVDRIGRRAGTRRYEAVFTLRERVFARLSETRVRGLPYDSMNDAVQSVARAAGITILGHGLAAFVAASTAPGTALNALGAGRGTDHRLLDRIRDGLRAYGLQVALIRDGVLHVGRWNDRPLAVRTLDTAGGLVAVERGSDRVRDPAAGERPPGAPASRGTVTLTALGRPDLKPGDTVSVVLPPEDFPRTGPAGLGSALLTSLTGVVTGSFGDEPDGPPATCLVTDVTHRISRRAAFVTTVHAVVLADEADAGWDRVKPATTPAPARTRSGPGAVPADTAAAAARAIHDVFADIAGEARDRMAQIRSHPASTQTGATPPRHTSEVWYADSAGDGQPASAQRIAITQDLHGEAREVPYLSPFAWGHYGLVLPRYPGTRVLLTTGGGGASDLIDVGALWTRDAGPPSQAGDYWLVLPIGVSNRTDIGSSSGDAPDGPATHDLVNGDGTRVIETKRFVVRVTDSPTPCTARPEPGGEAPEGAVLIESKKGGTSARIVLESDGTITVTASSITFDTAGRGDITLKAKNVKVQVTGTMDVS